MISQVRLWSLLRNEIPREGLDGRAGFWDEAIRGSSALRAAVSRHFMDESCDALGVSHLSILFDVEEFYDSLDVGLCIDRCLDLGYSPTIIGLSALTYLGPRLLRDRSSVSAPIDPSLNIAAGCRSAKNAAAAFLYPTLERIHNVFFPEGRGG